MAKAARTWQRLLVPSSGVVDYTIDYDLRQLVTCPPRQAQAPEDLNSMAPSTDTNQPLASKVSVANSLPPYYDQFVFLPPGTYTLAFTCEAALDNPDHPDSAVIFNPLKTGIAVVASQTTTVDIP